MSISLYWLHCGGCGGDTMSLLNAESPNLLDFIEAADVNLLWHPSFSNDSPSRRREITRRIVDGEQPLDVLCVEGAIIRGPGGTGMYDALGGVPKKDVVRALAPKANVVLAVGTCASFGGIGSDGDVEATGLQFHKKERGGFLGEGFRSRANLPVINLPGCPCHCDVILGTISSLMAGVRVDLTAYNTPSEWYGLLVHQGCTRNEYHEYRVEEENFGERGCLFFHMGCRGPLTYGPCNKVLWNGRSSKTRVGVPCFGCTQPDFPQPSPFFYTENIEGVPLVLPDGVDRAHYLAYKGMAAAAAPLRLKQRRTRV